MKKIAIELDKVTNIEPEQYIRKQQTKDKHYKFYGELLTKDDIFEKDKKLYTIGTICIWNDDTSFIKITKEIYLTHASKNVWFIMHGGGMIIKIRNNDIYYATIYKPIE